MKIFISYAHVDKFLVKSQIVDILINAGHAVWFDERLVVGQDWKEQLSQAVADNDALLYAITPESVASEWCQWELARAVELGKPIVPVLLQARTPIPDRLSDIQIVDFTDGATGDAVARLMGGLQRLSSTQVADAPTNPKGIPAEAMTSQTPARFSLIQKIGASIGGIILFFVTIFGVLPESTRNTVFTSLGLLTPTPTATATVLPTDTPSPTMTLSPTATLTPTDEATNTPVNTPATPIVRADEETSIRRGPSAGFEIMMAWDGRPLDILGISEDGLWYQVLLRDGRRGWVLTSQNVVDVDGNQEIIPVIEITNTPVPPTSTPTDTNTPTITPSDTPTLTITPSPTYTPSPTDTPTPSHTPRIPPTARPTNTPIPTATSSQCLGVIPGVGGMINQVKVLPNPNSPARSPVQRGSTVVVLDVTSDFGTTWYRIEYDDTSGWIPEDYVDVPSNCP